MTENHINSQPLRFTTEACRGDAHPEPQVTRALAAEQSMPATDAALRWGSRTHHILAAIAYNNSSVATIDTPRMQDTMGHISLTRPPCVRT